MLELKEDIRNEQIVHVCSGVLLVNMKFDVLADCIKIHLNIIVMLSNSELLYLSNFRVHVDFEVRTNATKNQCKNCQSIILFIIVDYV